MTEKRKYRPKILDLKKSLGITIETNDQLKFLKRKLGKSMAQIVLDLVASEAEVHNYAKKEKQI